MDFFVAVDLSVDRLFAYAHRSFSKTETVRKSKYVIDGLRVAPASHEKNIDDP